MKSERFPSWIQEGWIRLQFSLLTSTDCGERVVKAKIRIVNFHHLPQIHE
jgi:hypothetical protein